ncbi:MAG: hypothetical protein Q7R35_02555 [Elusimicrobiota bacterium]|nr:hypothetical protein [Elusimicrobiota bacterium]
MKKLTLIGLVVAAGLLSGCKKQVNLYKADLAYQQGAVKYDFSVSVKDEVLYVSIRRNGVGLPGLSGNRVPGGEVAGVAAADLNADGTPELYVFLGKDSSAPALLACSCGEKECASIGMEGGGGGQEPMDYCGGDSYKIEGNRLFRHYNGCKQAKGERLFVKYALKETSFGLMLSSAGIGKATTTQ